MGEEGSHNGLLHSLATRMFGGDVMARVRVRSPSTCEARDRALALIAARDADVSLGVTGSTQHIPGLRTRSDRPGGLEKH